MFIKFHTLRYKNILSIGNSFIELELDKNRTTLVSAKNGSGKCLDKTTVIDIDFKNEEVRNKFIQMKINNSLYRC